MFTHILENKAHTCHLPQTWETLLLQAVINNFANIRDNSRLKFLRTITGILPGLAAFCKVKAFDESGNYPSRDKLQSFCFVRVQGSQIEKDPCRLSWNAKCLVLSDEDETINDNRHSPFVSVIKILLVIFPEIVRIKNFMTKST